MNDFTSRFGPALMVLLVAVASAQARGGEHMSGDMMSGGMMMSGWMMLVCAIFGVLVLLVLVLVILALLKYLRGDRVSKRGRHAP